MAQRTITAAALLLASPLVCVAPTAAQASDGRAEHPWGGPQSQLVWLDAQAGVESVQMQTFNADFETMSVGLLPAAGVGPTANVGAGIRFVFLTLGLRGRVSSFEDNAPAQTVGAWQIWTLDGEIGLRVPLRRIEPHTALAAGYTSFGGFGTALHGLSAGLDVHGVDVRLDAGVDYWITHGISIGVDASAGVLAVARPGISARDLATPKQVGTINEAKARVLEASGSSVGSMYALTGDLGLHF